ncbi:MAG: hypothetical protein AUK47_18940 [Deltaproteobacteria bacterium CG2_30_63_29]|nr:MAG: hypothetical protein AUK47_18940 [Deltaproteobacteria bacterium CG2_30_63_29]
MIIFGGMCKNEVGIYVVSNRVFSLELNRPDSILWVEELFPSGAQANAVVRLWHATAFDTVANRLLLYGGVDGNGTPHGELWALDFTVGGKDGMWKRLETLPDGPLSPGARSGHTMVIDDQNTRAIVFGGVWPNSPMDSELTYPWALDLLHTGLAGSIPELDDPLPWKRLSTGGTRPNIRARHSSVGAFARDRLVVFGGVEYFPETSGGIDHWYSNSTAALLYSVGPRFNHTRFARFVPSAIYDNKAAEGTTLEVAPTQQTPCDPAAPLRVTAYSSEVDKWWHAVPKGLPVVFPLELLDDGTNGDRVACDGIYSFGPLSYNRAVNSARVTANVSLAIGVNRAGVPDTVIATSALRIVNNTFGGVLQLPVDDLSIPKPERTLGVFVIVSDDQHELFRRYEVVSRAGVAVDTMRTTSRFFDAFEGQFDQVVVVPCSTPWEATGREFSGTTVRLATNLEIQNIGLPETSSRDLACCDGEWGDCTRCDSDGIVALGSQPRAITALLSRAYGPYLGGQAISGSQQWTKFTDVFDPLTAPEAAVLQLNPDGVSFTQLGYAGQMSGPAPALSDLSLYMWGFMPLDRIRIGIYHLLIPPRTSPPNDWSSVTFQAIYPIDAALLRSIHGGERQPPSTMESSIRRVPFVVVCDRALTPAEVVAAGDLVQDAVDKFDVSTSHLGSISPELSFQELRVGP